MQPEAAKPPAPESSSSDDEDVSDDSLPDADVADFDAMRPRVINARDFRFSHGQDPLVNEKWDHPLSQLPPMASEDFGRCLKIFCCLESIGEGVLGSDLVQIGAFSIDGQKLFVPILPPKSSRSMLEKFV